jgi:hypothetical protein
MCAYIVWSVLGKVYQGPTWSYVSAGLYVYELFYAQHLHAMTFSNILEGGFIVCKPNIINLLTTLF